MADIEPYKQIQKTNINEHNDLVGKINEIIEVINQTNLETIVPKISKLEQDVSAINVTDSLQWNDIETVKTDIDTINPKIAKLEQDITTNKVIDTEQSNAINSIKDKNTEQDNTLATHATEIDGIRKTLVSDVALMNGTTSGNIKVRLGREDAPSIDSNDYNIQKPTSVELVQGSAPAMIKAQITLSDGTVLVSDDFMFTTEAIGQDVYISSFVFKNGNVAGSISADIGLSNGSTLTANNFAVPTDPNVTTAISDLQGKVTTTENDINGLKTTVNGHTTSINGLDSEVSDLQTRMTAVEGGTIVGLDELKQTVDSHTTSISALDSDVANLQIDKADTSNGNQSIVAGSISANNISKGGVGVATLNDIPDISGKVNIAQGSGNAGKVLGINASGNVEPMNVSGGEVWETVDLSNFPKNWVTGDRVKMIFKQNINPSAVGEWATATCSMSTNQNNTDGGAIFEFELGTSYGSACLVNFTSYSIPPNSIGLVIAETTNVVNWNGANNYMMSLVSITFNGNNCVSETKSIKTNSVSTYVQKMWRLKK